MTIVDMRSADLRDASYDILYVGVNVHKITGARHNPHAPHRIKVWLNAARPNPHPGEVKWTNFGSIGGDGKYLDPHNKATDDDISVLTSAEGVAITSNGTNTGTKASGQVYGEQLAVGETVSLRLPSGRLLGPYLITQRPLHDPELALI